MINSSTYINLIKYESDFRDHLVDKTGKVFLEHYDIWQREIMRLARHLGKFNFEQNEIDKGLKLAQNPIFICGAPRSGTTYCRDLFDNHPQICALPGESKLLTSLLPVLQKINHADSAPFCVDMWLRNFLVPCVNDPFSILGKSEATHSPYVDFARYFLTWWDITSNRYPDNTFNPLISWMLALNSYLNEGCIPSTYQYWLDKTTMNEHFIDEIRSELPNSLFLIMVRHPVKVYHSRKERDVRGCGRFLNKWITIKDLCDTHKIQSEISLKKDNAYLQIIKYEDFIADREKHLSDICDLLKIQYNKSMNIQTVLGQSAYSNTSFTDNKSVSKIAQSEEKTLSALLSHHSSTVGYDLLPMPFYEKLFWRLKYYVESFSIRVIRRIKRLLKWAL